MESNVSSLKSNVLNRKPKFKYFYLLFFCINFPMFARFF